MKEIFNIFLSAIISIAVLFSINTSAYASTDVSVYDTSLLGLEKYIEISDSDLLIFDADSAIANGYPCETVEAIKQHISNMNLLVELGYAYIDQSFSAVIQLPATNKKHSGIPLFRSSARGESKVVTHWYGLTEIYMNSDEAQDLINALSAAGDGSTVASLLSFLPGGLGTILGSISTISGVQITLYRWQIEQAAAPGRGIIMNVQYNFTTNDQSIWFVSQ